MTSHERERESIEAELIRDNNKRFTGPVPSSIQVGDEFEIDGKRVRVVGKEWIGWHWFLELGNSEIWCQDAFEKTCGKRVAEGNLRGILR